MKILPRFDDQGNPLRPDPVMTRSRLMLDQDRAVRSANLAGVYRDAGMTEASLREAARAVTYDYANDSAHLFISDTFNELRDPTRRSSTWLSSRFRPSTSRWS